MTTCGDRAGGSDGTDRGSRDQNNFAGAGDPGDDGVTENRGDADRKEEPAAAEGWRSGVQRLVGQGSLVKPKV